jgi:PAS domain-containing protein
VSGAELLPQVADALPYAICVVDGAGRVAYVNAAHRRYAGLDDGLSLVGLPVGELVRLLAFRGVYGPGDPEALARTVLAMDRRPAGHAADPRRGRLPGVRDLLAAPARRRLALHRA